MSDGTPARIDRAALERIIRRAAELQAAEREIGDDLTTDEVLALGHEVGIPGRYLQQAMLEERTRIAVAAPHGVWDRLVGPAQLAAQRVVRGEPDEVERALLRWIDQHELLCVQRHQSGRITWEPMGGVQAAIRRSTAALGSGKRPFMLSRAETVSAAIVGVEPGYSLVTLTASAQKARGGYIGGGIGLTAAGVASTTLMLALGALLPVALLPLPAALGIGYSVVRRYAPAAMRIQLGLERALDYLEQGSEKPEHQLPEPTPGLFGLLANEVRKALKP
jgi:hypothetical protein